jgi:hypothetical protein
MNTRLKPLSFLRWTFAAVSLIFSNWALLIIAGLLAYGISKILAVALGTSSSEITLFSAAMSTVILMLLIKMISYSPRFVRMIANLW